MTQRIIRCTNRHLDRMLEYISVYNPAGEHHIGYFGVTPEDIRQSVLMLNLRYDRGFRLALEGNQIVGAMGMDFDREIGRTWLYGPIVTSENWDATADALYAAVGKVIPPEISEQEMFIDSLNERCRNFATRHAFVGHGSLAIYFITPDRLAKLPAAAADEWDDRLAGQFVSLHEQLFPRSNYTLNYMLAERDKGATLLTLSDGDQLTGYFFGRAEQESGEAYVDLVGVNPNYRRQGLGRRMMLAGLAQLRGLPGLRQVNLTVDSDNYGAMQLYDSLGFMKERDMAAFRKTTG